MYEHNGIAVTIKIDFLNQTITLGDIGGDGKFLPKQWIFKNRGLEYMEGWQAIFDAMSVCTKFATGELQEYVDKEAERKEALMLALAAEELKKK